jgi:urease accessory protein
MYFAGYPSEQDAGAVADALGPVRASGGLKARFKFSEGATRLADLTEYGGYRLRFPTTHAAHAETSQVNTGGGVAGGDRLIVDLSVGDGADVVHATATAERIYRSIGPSSRIDVGLTLGDDARLDWLPQETILYSGSRLERRFDVNVSSSSRLLMVELMTFGRVAHGEILADGLFRDNWRVRRDGRLVFAEAIRLDDEIGQRLARPAIAAGAAGSAVILLVAPDAEEKLDSVRAALTNARSDCGASAWNGMLAARFLGAPEDVRQDVIRAFEAIAEREAPRVWQS